MPPPNQDPRFDTFAYPLQCKPGIKRDGTSSDGDMYVDGSWCRFRLGRPKKIGGYREVVNGLDGPIRENFVQAQAGLNIVFSFSGAGVSCVQVDDEGVGGATYSRTPGGWVSADSFVWTVDTMYDSTGSPATKVIAHPSSSLLDIKSDTNTSIYYGDATAATALTAIAGQSVSGGIVVLQPFLFTYGSNGLIKNSVANDPATFTGGDSNSANVAGTKIVRGLPLRGGSNSPAGLFWSLDSLVRVTYVGGTAKWRYDTVSGKSTILSSHGVIEVDGVYYWPGIDRFLMYNGVVKELMNPINQDFFFDNLNWPYRQKVWATSVPRYGEIWWHFPKKPATECNWAIIYNYRENIWYDTPSYRSAGYAPKVLYFPVWSNSESNSRVSANKYNIYRQETGTDHVYGENQVAIDSYFETCDLGFVSAMNAQVPNVNTRITTLEPDFDMAGDMTVQVIGSATVQDADIASSVKTFDQTTGVVDFREQRRIMRLKFDSNTQGGDYHAGKSLLHIEPGDKRR